MPYLGFPYSLKNILFTLSGLGIMYFSYVLYTESVVKENKEEKTFDNFSENIGFDQNKAESKFEGEISNI